jgi:hypothetical protein
MKPWQRCNAVTRATIRACGMCAMIITITLVLAQSPHTTPLLRKLDEGQLRSIERLVLGHAEVQTSFRGATPRVIIGEPELIGRTNRSNIGPIHRGRFARRMESRDPRPGDTSSAWP